MEVKSDHQETVTIPPGKKAVVKMTSYRVRYKLDYTMEYKIPKSYFMELRNDVHGCVCLDRKFHCILLKSLMFFLEKGAQVSLFPVAVLNMCIVNYYYNGDLSSSPSPNSGVLGLPNG